MTTANEANRLQLLRARDLLTEAETLALRLVERTGVAAAREFQEATCAARKAVTVASWAYEPVPHAADAGTPLGGAS